MQALRVSQLTKTYKNGLAALKGINLDVAEGDFFALLGQNGAGKSTTIGIICSLINKTAGKIWVFGNDTDTHLDAAKACIAVVPQEMNFNPFEKVIQVVVNQAGFYGIPKSVAYPRAEYYLKKMGLWNYHNQPILRLSGGMKRRLMIARALVVEPKLLILDEPTAGVDIELRHMLWEFLTDLNQKGTTIILTTHYLEEAEHLCKNLAIIDHGEIIERSDMKSLINKLHIQTVILDSDKKIEKLPVITDYPCKLLDDVTIEAILHKDQSLNGLFGELSKHQISITGMRNKTNRLEELFINLIKNGES